MDYIKISDEVLGVRRPRPEPEIETVTYKYSYLIKQKKNLEDEMAIVMDKFKAQIAEIDLLIGECVKLGLKEPKIEAEGEMEI